MTRPSAPSASSEDETARLDGDSTRVTELATEPDDARVLGATNSREDELPSTHQGRYVLIEELGRGGMGVVWRAYDTKLQREVALKSLHSEGLPQKMQLRMLREAQAMAKLSHPNVVAIYDAEQHGRGMTLAMELVDGQTLSRWSRSKDRSPAEIVAAFVQAGRGLVAAHQAGLFHRDFKPSNVLVGSSGVIKVTDFGLARLASDESERSSVPSGSIGSEHDSARWDLTRSNTVMGTPAYMAPEQHGVDSLTPAVDQYAFCASLWHVLTGSLPFTVSDDAADRMAELLERKRGGAPTWPRSRPLYRRWVAAIRRGLEPRPEERWPTVLALLEQLEVDPIRRRRGALVLGGLVLAAGLGVGAHQHARHTTTVACEEEGAAIAEVWSESQSAAIAEAFAATELPFASDAWGRTSPLLDAWAREWQEHRTRACLDGERERSRSADELARIRACLDDQGVHVRTLVERWQEPSPSVASAATLAAWGLPSPPDCLDPLVLAQRGALEQGDPQREGELASLRGQLAQAEALLSTGQNDESMRISESLLFRAKEQEASQLAVAAQVLIGKLHVEDGRFEQAEEALRAGFLAAEAAGDDPRATTAASTLSFVLGYHLARPDEAQAWSELASAKQARLGLAPDDPRIADSLRRRGSLLVVRHQYEPARELLIEALEVLERRLGPDHPRVSSALNNVALAEFHTGNADAAVAAYERSRTIAEQAYGPEHPSVAYPLNNLTIVLLRLGRNEEALAVIERALEIREAAFGPDHLDVAASLNNLAGVMRALDRPEDMLVALQRAMATWEAIYGPDHARVAKQRYNLGLAYLDLERPEDALEAFKQLDQSLERVVDADPKLAAECQLGMAKANMVLERPRDAVALLEPGLAELDERVAVGQLRDSWRLLLAQAWWEVGEREPALSLARQALAGASDATRPDIEAWLADRASPDPSE